MTTAHHHRDDFIIRIAGESGEGVITIGETLCRIAAREGLSALTFRTFPAEIKGGPCMIQVRLGGEKVSYHGEEIDLLVCLNQAALEENLADLKEHGVLVCEAECDLPEGHKPATVFKIPLERIAIREIGSRISKNVVALGVLCHLLGIPEELMEQFLRQKFAKKSKAILDHNLDALKKGLDCARAQIGKKDYFRFSRANGQRKLLMTGNEAIALGAAAAGMRYFFGYPITPASEVMEWLAAHLPKLGGKVLQTEDEISAICGVAGASWAGGKAMTATSGPGLSLMAETIGLISMAEIPAVIVDCQRGGPSTGLPTKTEQSDLFIALYGTHGDAPRVVIAPTSVQECFQLTALAFDLAEKYQIPVIVLSDQALSARLETVDSDLLARVKPTDRLRLPPGSNGGFARYQLTESGISPVALPGTAGGEHMVTGMEHDERGNFACDERTHTAMTVKRFRKLAGIENDPMTRDLFSLFGAKEAAIGIVTWGTTLGPVKEAVELAGRMGIPVRAFVPKILNPLPNQALKGFLAGVKKVIVPELNFCGQFASILRSTYCIPTIGLTKVKGVPIEPSEIVEKIVETAEELKTRSEKRYGRAGQVL